MASDVPVTVIGGFLGAGKTTLVNRLIRDLEGRRVGVLVNDFGELAIDQRMIVAAEEDVVSLANGCICCSMRGGVMSTVYQLLERDDAPEHLIVEASGVSDPRSLAEIFIEAEKIGTVRLDALISVVDTERFDHTDNLARAQVQATDLVVLNKTDLVDRSRIDAVTENIRALSPDVRIVETVEGAVPVELLIGGGATALREAGPIHGVDASRFETWTYERKRPFEYRKLLPRLTSLPSAIYRAKGVLSLVEREGKEIVVQIVGKRLWLKTLGEWTEDRAKTSLVVIGEKGEVDFDALANELDAL